MGQTIFAGNVLQALLIWLQSLMSGIWSLVSGASGGTLLKWLGEHWLKLLVFFLIVGIVGDKLVWLIRWRPHWAWFRKKRMIIDDEILEETPRRRASTRVPKRVTASASEEPVDLFLDDPLFATSGVSSKANAAPAKGGLKVNTQRRPPVSSGARTDKRKWR